MKKHREKTYQSLVLLCKLKMTVRWKTERETEGVLQPEEICTNTRERVMEVLRTKRPDAHTPSTASLDMYPDSPLELVPVDITEYTVTEVAGRQSRGAGPGGTDLVSLHHRLLKFGAVRGELLLTVAEFSEWLGNGRPP